MALSPISQQVFPFQLCLGNLSPRRQLRDEVMHVKFRLSTHGNIQHPVTIPGVDRNAIIAAEVHDCPAKLVVFRHKCKLLYSRQIHGASIGVEQKQSSEQGIMDY